MLELEKNKQAQESFLNALKSGYNTGTAEIRAFQQAQLNSYANYIGDLVSNTLGALGEIAGDSTFAKLGQSIAGSLKSNLEQSLEIDLSIEEFSFGNILTEVKEAGDAFWKSSFSSQYRLQLIAFRCFYVDT